jgi:uncharacterized protein (DUF1501 family)
MRLSRRNFLEGALSGGALLTLSSTRPSQLAFAASPGAEQIVLIVVHLRGGCDGLNLLCPANDPNLIAARPVELRVSEASGKAGYAVNSAATPSIDWRLHSAAPELAELYQSKTLAFVHAAGIPEPNRSHFVATDIMDHGAAGSAGLAHSGGGWLGRYLSQFKIASGLPAISASGALADEFSGFDGALSVPDLANGLPLPWDEKAAGVLEVLYRHSPGVAAEAGVRVLEAAKLISARLPRGADGKFAPYLDQKEAYDKAGDVGSGLRTLARLIKADVGLVAASVDAGGWDTHVGQQGRFQKNVRRFSSALGAFWNDIASHHARVTIVAYGEFGRRLRASKSGGTDHGRGGVMIAMGAGVAGGRILGPWPGLEEAALDERVDLAVETDYRQVLTEVLTFHGGKLPTEHVFPGYRAPARLGIFA